MRILICCSTTAENAACGTVLCCNLTHAFTSSVGIPEVFAKRLSWPEPVNQHNVRRLRHAVLNGPDVWPGANYVIDEKGNKIDLSKKGQQFRTALAKQLERKDARGLNWKVGRHLNHGDFVLVNRQPTLHKVFTCV
jgi:DNA-directed RNA polymerase I subunit RPA1